MIGDKPKKGDDYAEAKYAGLRRRELGEALTRYIQKNGGSVVSLPNSREMRVEVQRGSVLPVKLAELGYAARSVGVATRLVPNATSEIIDERVNRPRVLQHGGFVDVEILEISLPGK